MHGGTNPGAPVGNTNALKHGIYRAHLTEDEQEAYDSLAIGQLDEELRLARIRLARTLGAETKHPDTGTDYASIIDRQLGRIEGLEWTRARMLGGKAVDGEGNYIVIHGGVPCELIDPNPDIP
jgi:hypothetical protein